MRKLLVSLLSIAAMFQVALVALPAGAQGLLNNAQQNLGTFAQPAGYQQDQSGNQLLTTIGKVIQLALGFMGIIFVLFIIYAGFLWMTAGGNGEAVTKAKDIIKNCIIGLIIMVLAYSITTFVFAQLTKATQ